MLRFNDLLRLALIPLAMTAPLRAQDSSAVRVTSGGIVVDFQDADIRSVITALAEAGGLNVGFADLPAKHVTLRLRQGIPKKEIANVLKSLASTYDLVVSEEAGILRFAAIGPPSRAQPSRDTPIGEEQLFIYRLKHARAAVLAPTLEHIFGARGGVTTPPAGLTQPPLSQRLREQQIPPLGAEAAQRIDPAGPALSQIQGTTLAGQVRNQVQIMADEATNALLIKAQPSDLAIVRQAIEAMDLRPLQALIEVVIAEVTQTGDLEFGVSASGSNTTKDAQVTGQLSNTASSDFVAQIVRTAGGFSMTAAMNALASRGHVRILSRPVLLAQNNKEARILVGSQRPFIQVSQSVPTNVSVLQQVVQYRDVGTSLTILPTINPDGYINLQVSQEVSTATTETQFGAPVISTREASTQVFVKDAQTAVLGGLVDREQDKSRSGIPLLSSIPLIGALFGSTSIQTTTSELFLFLTPHIIARDEDLDRIREDLKQGSADETGLGRPVSAPMISTSLPSSATNDSSGKQRPAANERPVTTTSKPIIPR